MFRKGGFSASVMTENRNKFALFDGNINPIKNKRGNFSFIARIAEAYSVCFDKTFFILFKDPCYDIIGKFHSDFSLESH